MSSRGCLLYRTLALVLPIALLTLCCNAPAASAQSSTSSFRSDDLHARVNEADRAAALHTVHVNKHPYFARTPAALAARHDAAAALSHSSSIPTAKSFVSNAGDDFTQNPGDMTFQGGPTILFAASHAVFINPGGACTIAGCWGDPETFLEDVGQSDFVHLLDQYTGISARNRYLVGSRAVLTDPIAENPLLESDLIAILHSVVSQTGLNGYGHIYHLFLPPGVDTCFDPPANQICYSPGVPATFFFCAYHASVTFPDLGHVIFTVEPWQGPGSGCEDPAQGAPNGQLIDSTDDTLSHEFSETISDPDGNAWWNRGNFALIGSEIGDECLFVGPNGLLEPTFKINKHLYRVQSEYSNAKHACAISPHN